MVACHRCPNLGYYSSVSRGIDRFRRGHTYASLAELADAVDSNSTGGKSVRVRIPQLVPLETTLPIKCSPNRCFLDKNEQYNNHLTKTIIIILTKSITVDSVVSFKMSE